MKSVIRLVTVCLISGMMVCSVSCSKKGSNDKIPGEASANYWPDQRYCNIDSIKINNSTRYYKFTYDAQGDPVSMITNQPGTGNPNRFFFYDANKRMIIHYGLYSDGVTFERYTKYVYGSNNKVIRDTTYNFGTLSGGLPTNYYSWYVVHYTYDSAGRITNKGNYDANGNMIRSGITYDVKNNIHNTNNWWRLIDMEYSVNNPYTASSYTGYWLPRNFISNGITNERYFLNIDMTSATFKYTCD